MIYPRYRMLAAVLILTPVAAGTLAPSAAAQVGGIVHDPRNYAQNILTAARTLEQINNQISMLQNQATSLVNEARNLEGLPVSTLQELQGGVERTKALLGEAQRVAYDVTSIQSAFDKRYKGGALTGSQAAMVAGAEARWNDSVAAFQDAMKVQAGVVGNMDGTRRSVTTLVTASQSATGALQAAQVGNQLLALQSQQLGDLAAAIAAQGRAQMLDAARSAAAEAEGRERFRRFRERN